MRKTFLLLLIFAFQSSAWALETNPGILKVRVEMLPPYFEYTKGEWKGMVIDYYEALSQESGLKLEYVRLPWSRAMKDIVSGECHIIAHISRSKNRESLVHFVGPITEEKMILVVNQRFQNVKITSLHDLVNLAVKEELKIAIQNKVNYGDLLNTLIEKDKLISKVFFRHTNNANYESMTSSGRLLGYLELLSEFNLKHQLTPSKHENLSIHKYEIYTTDVWIGVSKKLSSSTITLLEEANSRLISSGKYRAIANKWNNNDTPAE